VNKPTILYFIRSEADLERITSIAIPGKAYAKQFFAYYGDIDFLFDRGIKNRFQKELLRINTFEVIDIVTLSLHGKLYRWIAKEKPEPMFIKLSFKLIEKFYYKFFHEFQNKERLAKKLLRKINPSILITDNSVERENYFPHILRQEALKKNIKVHATNHGPAGALHKHYSAFDYINGEYKRLNADAFEGCEVGVTSKNDYGAKMPNRVLTGDPSDSYPHLLYKHKQKFDEINFLNDRSYKVGFFMSAPFETATNSWSNMEEIMLDLSFKDNIAMVAKFHPRLYKLGDFRYLKKIDNLKLYGPELDRTRLIKWADIIICSDHCSMLFEGMIFQKKVVAIHSKKTKPFEKFQSKIHGCHVTMNSIHTSKEFKIDSLKNYSSDTGFIDEYCWGGLGKIDLGEKIIKDLLLND